MVSNEHDFDARDEIVRARCIVEREKIEGPRVGDFFIRLDGSVTRFTCQGSGGLQTMCRRYEPKESGSFHLSLGGGVSFSGSLDPSVSLSRIRERKYEYRNGFFWIWHHGEPGVGRGVTTKAPCRVFEEVE